MINRKMLIPNMFTLLNMLAGFLAVLQIQSGHYRVAAALILAAAVFDGLDGLTARLLHQQSDFGIEFDSLADLISFGLAPATLIHAIYVPELGLAGALLSFFPLAFGAIRLARFNLSATAAKKKYFSGLPIPASALTISSFVWFHDRFFGHYGDARVALPLTVILSFLMVSRIHFSANLPLKVQGAAVKNWKNLLAFGLLAVLLLFPSVVLFPLCCIYILINLSQWLVADDQPHPRLLFRRMGP